MSETPADYAADQPTGPTPEQLDRLPYVALAEMRALMHQMEDERDAALARVDALTAALAEHRAQFIKHRTATHEIKPRSCVTCQESDAILATDPPERGRQIVAALAAVLGAVTVNEGKRDRIDIEAMHDAVERIRALGVTASATTSEGER